MSAENPIVALRTAATTAPCPKCSTTMVLAAVTPHPLVPQMKRHTFLCATVAAVACLALLVPMLLLVLIAIKLDSRGPIFVRETRYGCKNRVI